MSTGRGSRRTQGKESRQRIRDAFVGGMTGQGKNAAVREAVDKLLERSRETGMPIVVTDLKAGHAEPPQP